MHLGVLSLTDSGPQTTTHINARASELRRPGWLKKGAECRSDSNTISYLCTLSAAPELKSANARASVRCQIQNSKPDTPTTHAPYLRRVRLGTPGRLNYAERRSDSNTMSYLCTLLDAPEMGSASARASEVSVNLPAFEARRRRAGPELLPR